MISVSSTDTGDSSRKMRIILPAQEFSLVFMKALYIPPATNANIAMGYLLTAIKPIPNPDPDGIFISARDVNHTELKSVPPKFVQHVNQRG